MSQARAKLFFIFSLVVMFAVSATVVYNNYQAEFNAGTQEFSREVVHKNEVGERAEDAYERLRGTSSTRGLKQTPTPATTVTPATGLRFYQKPRTTPRGFDLTADILGFILLCFLVLLVASCSC